MPKVSPLQSTFIGGEYSPLIYGRVDSDRYKEGLAACVNYIPIIQGPITRRPGTKYVAQVRDSSKATRVVRFEFSTTQAYIIEFGDLYCRFYMNNGQILSGGVPYEIASPYTAADVFDLRFTQSADVLYITHPNYAQRKLSRTGHTAWTLTTITFLDGPYLSTNATTTTLTPSAATGAITITASSITGINGDTGFKVTDIGRVIRMKEGATWGYARITGFTDTTHVSATVVNTLTNTNAKTSWRLGLWSDTTGYPACVTFHEDRLVFAGSAAAPQRVDASASGDYENFLPSATDGTIAANHAFALSVNSSEVDVIRWIQSHEKGLLIGTVSKIWLMRPSSATDALSATNANAKPANTKGGAANQPLSIGSAVLFIQTRGRKIRELTYSFYIDGFESPDLTVLAEHITAGGIVEMAHQDEPQTVVWAARADGVLLGLTYERGGNDLKAGWHRHILGGYSDAARTVPAKVESVAVIPSADGTREEAWMVVNRYINGGTKRYIEYMTKLFEDTDAAEDAFFVDCGLTYSGVPATSISGLDHLEGESVAIWADGAVQPNQTVASGAINLTVASSKVQIGEPYNSDGQMLRIEAGAADGTALGKTRRANQVAIHLHRTLGLSLGLDFDNLNEITFRHASDPLDTAVPLFSGIKRETTGADYDTENQICWRQSQPTPGTIQAVMPQMTTQDR